MFAKRRQGETERRRVAPPSFVQLFDDKAIAMLKDEDKHVALTEFEANANDPAAALAQPKINRTKGTPSWDFGDDSLGDNFRNRRE